MDKKFLIILGVAIAILAGIFIFSGSKSEKQSTASTASVSNHSTGNLSSNVEVLEYADFQCPACGQFFPLVQQVKAKYKDTVKFTFRHFPLDNIHPNARSAARAAEAAGNQGKFFEMHDLLFENQNAWAQTTEPLTFFSNYARQLSLDEAKFKADYASATTNDIINADLNEGKQKGVTGTPSFYINGVAVKNTDISDLDKFSAKIDETLKANQ